MTGPDHPHADRRYLVTALLLTACMITEIVVAFVSGSLALLSDAGHMLSDVGAIAASLWAIRLAARPATGAWTQGWKLAEILSAAANGITLLVVDPHLEPADPVRTRCHRRHLLPRRTHPHIP